MKRRLRLTSGLILFAFLATHLANHALGLISLAAMEEGRQLFLALWRNLPATLLLYAAFIVHLGLAFEALYARRSFKMRFAEVLQILLGLAIPPLLLIHILGSRMAYEVFGLDDSYAKVLYAYWGQGADAVLRQTALTTIAWAHATIGLAYWLRLKPWYPALRPWLFAAALVLPLLGLLGFVAGGRELLRLLDDPLWRAANNFPAVLGTETQQDFVYWVSGWVERGFWALLVLLVAGRGLRAWWARRHGRVRITYTDGRSIEVKPGTTILEASREAGIPHASVCGGRGRCSTCRVRVGAGFDELPPASESEAKVLRRIKAAPNVRLACQTRPTAAVEVAPLLPPLVGAEALRGAAVLQGEEREIAILFADLRDFTRLSEKKLPYDVVFILNRYFETTGKAVEEAGGQVDKFIGDGVMALFGVDSDGKTGSLQALKAAQRMAERLEGLNISLAGDLERPLRIGIGIHTGPAIVGELGHGKVRGVTAVGDTVNTASRLEGLTKVYGAQLVLSEETAELAGVPLDGWPREEIEIRGRDQKLGVLVVDNAAALAL